ncbi:hopanoid biosynthesis-associated protein HpnK [Acetobacter tropicalis]|uniref:hopanoid biosynthesis-associated protein HpnK n=1 Tax=Acetobacter TaxID=434 RepID=UPI00128BC6CB|nr:hopanoid biosynthesis-associated protein HpnK [Acetobacter senegalensis]MCG4257411.1 hopanoid biosynthesis-associated protein HpnK [Acetobacter senegalensis]MCG4261240.1 hopanoid biosynthesis-associated protein HpnK [Acetobacter senegalensis]MCG4267387.1 hopanoid biosynthesis-associated protein HpnK [Acetobacter senegalensis]MCG4274167.1 hopanoid biosynthesis-associated protein HpnK [Acetobacter senegalensis]MDN7356093.1 hopanoid biosynthesis-associated protein HpnK [Acetobacter senegalensi
MKRAIISADDFGLSVEVNEAIEIAHREGVLSTASLMVAGPAAEDAVERAKRLPNLGVGLHLVVIEGASVLPHTRLPLVTQPDGWFSSSQLGLGIDYFFRPEGRKELAAEITAQFEAFRRTGLVLDHANAHKHMHLHPTVGRLLIDIGKQYGLRAVRTPLEPPEPLYAAGTYTDTLGDAALRRWTNLLRHQILSAGLVTNDWCFGLAWSGHMTADRVAALAAHLPEGVSEIYFHPATHKNALLQKLMPTYEHKAEFEALCSSGFRAGLEHSHAVLSGWRDLIPS